jgi:O-antigen ligase
MDNFQELFNWVLFASFYSWPFAAALALGLAIPASGAIVSQITKSWKPSTLMLCIIVPLIIASITPVIFSGRIIYTEAQQDAMTSLQLGSNLSQAGTRATQIFTLLSLTISLGEIYKWLWGKASLHPKIKALWVFLMFYIISSVIVSNIFSEQPIFRIKDFYFFVTAASILLLAPHADERFWDGLRLALLVPTAGSLIAYLISPDFAALGDYSAAVPGISIRLYGLADHANSIGFVALGAAYIEFVRGKTNKNLNILALCIHLTVLVLSQSKTAWIAATMIMAISSAYFAINRAQVKSQKWQATIVVQITAILILTFSIIAIFIVATSSSVEVKINNANLYSLTGRSEIWKITLEEFYKNPWTGYGPDIWNESFRVKNGWPFVGQAHNQFIQTLGQSGILGFVTLIGYMGALLIASLRQSNQNFRIMAIGLYVLMLTRCITEVPLRAAGIAGWDNVFHLVLIACVVLGHHQTQTIKNLSRNI